MRKFLNTFYDGPIGGRLIRGVALVGIIVCGAWAIADFSLGLYKEAFAYTLFTAANGITLLLYRRR